MWVASVVENTPDAACQQSVIFPPMLLVAIMFFHD